LMTADEVRRLDENQQIVIIANKLPILGRRYWFTDKGKSAKPNQLGQPLTVKIELPEKDEQEWGNSNNSKGNNKHSKNSKHNNQYKHSNQSNQPNRANQTQQPKAVVEYRPVKSFTES